MNSLGWIILILLVVVLAMVLLTVIPQTGLLQSRVQQGIGTTTRNTDLPLP